MSGEELASESLRNPDVVDVGDRKGPSALQFFINVHRYDWPASPPVAFDADDPRVVV